MNTVCVCVHLVVSYSLAPWTVAHQAPLSVELTRPRILEWVAISYPGGSSQPRDQMQVSCISCIGNQILYH